MRCNLLPQASRPGPIQSPRDAPSLTFIGLLRSPREALLRPPVLMPESTFWAGPIPSRWRCAAATARPRDLVRIFDISTGSFLRRDAKRRSGRLKRKRQYERLHTHELGPIPMKHRRRTQEELRKRRRTRMQRSDRELRVELPQPSITKDCSTTTVARRGRDF